jgi:hypothetical protein
MNPSPPAARIAVSYQGVHSGALQVDTFFIGNDGALYVAWVVGTGHWNRPVRISRPNIAPPGASVTVGGRGSIPLAVFPSDSPSGTDAALFSAQVNVFFVGVDGALYVAWVIGLGAWNEPVRISEFGIAPPGASVATANQTSNQLDVFFIGNNGALHVAWASTTGSGINGWNGPIAISPPNVAPPGGNLVAIAQGANQLDVLFIGNNGALHVSWVVGFGNWEGPVGITPPIAPPGGGVCASRQTLTNDQLDVFFVANNGALHVSWVIGGGNWQGPVGITPLAIAPPGAGLIAAFQGSNQLDVLFVGNNGTLHVSWVVGFGNWQGPVGISPAQIAPPGASLAAIYQTVDQLDIFVTGQERWVSWVVGLGNWQGPVALPN